MTGYTRKDTSNNIADGNIINADDLDNEFDGVQSAFNATTGHTHDGTAAEGAPITKIGPVQDVIASASAIYPKTTNTVDLGTSSLKYKDAFLAGSASVGGALAVAGTTTLTSQPILSSLTASSAVATDASKGLVSVTNTGTGNNVLATSPTLVTPLLGTPTSVTLTNATGLPISTGVSGLGTGVATALAVNVGTAGAPVVNGGVLGTPSSGTVTNLTGTASININGTVGATTPTTGVFTALSSTGQTRVKGAVSTNETGLALGYSGSSVSLIGAWGAGGATRGILSFYLAEQAGAIGNEYMRLTDTGLAVTGTLSATGGVTLSGGTANGVAYLNGSKVLTTGSALTFDGTNFKTTGYTKAGGFTVVAGALSAFDAASGGLYGYYSSGGVLASYSDNSGTLSPLNFDGSYLAWRPAGSEQMRLTSTGRLGVGTTSPIAKLEVNGNIRTTPASGGTLSLFETDLTRSNFIVLGADASGAYIDSSYSSGGSGAILFKTTSTEQMRLDSSGNLGLGVTPSAWSVIKAIEIGGYRNALFSDNGSTLVGVASGAYYNAGWKYALTGQNVGRYDISSGAHAWYTASSGTAGNAITFSQTMTLDSSGRLGIGTTSPGSKLQIGATTDTGGINAVVRTTTTNLLVGQSGGAAFGFASGAASLVAEQVNTLAIGTVAATPLVFGTSGLERMRLDASGNLGIGTSSPSWRVHAVSPTNGRIQVEGASGYGMVFVQASSGNAAQLQLSSSGGSGKRYAISSLAEGVLAFSDETAALERMRLDSSGNLGLGVTPSAWGSGYRAIENLLYNSSYSNNSGVAGMACNAFNNGTNWIYKNTTTANRFESTTDSFRWFTAPSGTAGNAITFTQAMTLDASGRLLVGNTAHVQDSRFEATSTTLTPSILARSNVASDESQWTFQAQKKTATNTTSQVFVRFLVNDGATASGYITANGANAATFTSSSDERLKENIVDLPPQLNQVLALRPVEFDYKDGTGHQTGFIAQELQAVYPDCVSEGADGMLQIGGWSKTEARLVKAIQEQQALITSLIARVAQLESKPA